MAPRFLAASHPLCISSWALVATCIALAAGAPASEACCRVVTTCVPPAAECGYAGACAVGFAPGVVVSDLVVRDFDTCVQVDPLEVTSVSLACRVDLELSLDGGGTWTSYAAIPAAAHMTFTYLSFGSNACSFPPSPNPHASTTYTGTLDQLDIAGGGLPANLVLRESPAQASTGRTAVPTGGDWAVSSFFDVFFELSLDGGVTWLPALSSCTLDLGPSGATPARTSTWGRLKTIYR